MITGPDNQPWMADASCRDYYPEMFHALRNQRAERAYAVAICNTCLVRDQCLTFALEIGDTWAILGGTTPEQRRRTKRVAS